MAALYFFPSTGNASTEETVNIQKVTQSFMFWLQIVQQCSLTLQFSLSPSLGTHMFPPKPLKSKMYHPAQTTDSKQKTKMAATKVLTYSLHQETVNSSGYNVVTYKELLTRKQSHMLQGHRNKSNSETLK